jgi:hypothetical protein
VRRGERGELRQLAHDVRNALNGVAVNLEVARTRAARGADVAQIAPFLESAVQQLESATRLHKQYTDLTIALEADGARSGEAAEHR